jgi:hypothetical protein
MSRLLAAVAVSLVLFNPPLARADVVLDWNAIAASLPAPSGFEGARRLAIVQLAVFEAVNSITGEYEPYLDPAIVAIAGASPDAAAVQAAYDALTAFHPGTTTVGNTTLDGLLASSLALIPDGPAKDGGIATGHAAATAVIESRANDGSAATEFYFPSSANPGDYRQTVGPPLTCAAGLFFHWGKVRPFGIQNTGDFILPPPPALASVEYATDYLEVKTVGAADSSVRPQDRADVARFYAVTGAPYVFSAAAQQISTAQQRSLSHNARTLAVMAMAINDSYIVSFATKYTYKLWRPETAIRQGDDDGNDLTQGDPNFQTFIATPCFPSYPSNHASGSRAAAEVLKRAYGEGNHTIAISNPAIPNFELNYRNLNAICNDVDDARVYGGIHFRFDQAGGNRVGRAVAAYINKNLLRPLQPD